MIVSYSLGFIFIKTKKTAGSTVEAVLAPHCGPEDVITMSSPGEDGMPPVIARNFSVDPEHEAAYRRAVEKGEVRRKREDHQRARKDGSFFNHMPAADIRSKLDPEFWNTALKITTERHPYEKAVSQAYFRFNERQLHPDRFPEYLDRIVHNGLYVGSGYWTIDGEVAVDEFIRQENLQTGLERVGARLGIPIPAELPRIKSRSRLDPRPAREILTDAQKKIVYEKCAKEFEILGYER